MFRYPIGTREHLAVFQEEIAVIHQSKRRKTEASARSCLEGPAREQFVELIVDVRMTNDLTAGIGQEQAFNDPEFLVPVLVHEVCGKLVRMPAQELQQFLIAALSNCLTQLRHLLHRLW